MKRRLWSVPSLAMVLAIFLASCVPATVPTPPAATSAAPSQEVQPTETITLLWGFWGSPEEKASHERVADAYMQSHPGVKIEYFFAPWDDYFTKLKTLWAGGDPKAIPDVFFLWPTPAYAARGVLEDLKPYVERDNYNLKDYWPFLLDSASYNGDVYGFPRISKRRSCISTKSSSTTQA